MTGVPADRHLPSKSVAYQALQINKFAFLCHLNACLKLTCILGTVRCLLDTKNSIKFTSMEQKMKVLWLCIPAGQCTLL